MDEIAFEIAGDEYRTELLADEAPESIQALSAHLPLASDVKHVRWSGHAIWVEIDDLALSDVPRENHTVYPSRGDVLFYPGYRNEQEILIACGPTCFKSPAGELAGNHIGTIDASRDELRALEELTLEEGAQPVEIRGTE